MNPEARLPDNAFRLLEPGETYQPVVAPDAAVPEVTIRSVVQGVVWSGIFSVAATHIALKLGQGIESAIPISILAVGFSVLMARALGRRGSNLGAWGNWLGLASFLLLGAAVLSDAHRERVVGS